MNPGRLLRRCRVRWLMLVLAVAATEIGAAERILSLAPHLTEMIYAAGAGAKLAGAVAYSDFPPAALAVPRIGDAFRLDYERVAMLQPDLVLGWQSGNPREMTDRLVELGYTVVLLEPRRLDDIAHQIELIGDLAGTRPVATAAAQRFRTDVARLAADAAGKSTLRVFLQFSAKPLVTVNGEHIASEVLALCGGRNVFADLPLLAPTVGLEAVLQTNPDVVIATGIPGEADWTQDWQRWQSVRAVQNGALYTVHRDLLSRAGPRLIDGIREVCERLDDARQLRAAMD